MQEFLQHLFGFIGICTVLHWVLKLFEARHKGGCTNVAYKDLIDPLSKNTKNECPKCGSPLSLLRSTNTKKCTSCSYEVEWKLDKGQLPLVANNRMVKRDAKN